ncbi:ergot alkaloid biosynthesis protein, family [Variovorax sp. PBS-H4]|uniref:NmrA family NAD(P)-binding protein n=1 Tax=Variovorax sp. PBS-H4 TaxID=434008 RepID=UPI0013182054|nr:NmrA family NAD(P)-binding protein [Variovorax sp. PBS-H4]VTU40291.1 ergot alkaloid biosynthesis protein, family [Variovorax sp. PBS-H4]
MKIAVVGATGRIGAQLTQKLLRAGHQVRALSRGGPSLDALAQAGAEPFLGSFDTGAGELGKFFQGADAAFLMVKTDWASDIHGHYPAVARRFVDALRDSPVRLAVSLTAIGSEVKGGTGHFAGFHQLDQKLNELENVDLVHLRAGWFMENLLAWTGAIAKHGRIGYSLDPDLRMPWVATHDIADLAAHELNHPTGDKRIVREVGSEDLSMPEVAAMISREIGRAVEYRFIDRNRKDVEAKFLQRFGTRALWLYENQTLAALNDGRVRFHGKRRPLSTAMESFLRNTWKPHYLASLANPHEPESFNTWCAQAA